MLINNLTFKNTNCYIYDYLDVDNIFLNNLETFTFENHSLLRYLFIDEHIVFLTSWLRQLRLFNSVSNYVQLTNHGNIEFKNVDICAFLYFCELYSENMHFDYNSIEFFVGQTKIFYRPNKDEATKIDSYLLDDIENCHMVNPEKLTELFDGFEYYSQIMSSEEFVNSAFNYLLILTEILQLLSKKFSIGFHINSNRIIFLVSERYNAMEYEQFYQLAEKYSESGLARVVNGDVQYLSFIKNGVEFTTHDVAKTNRDIPMLI